MGGRTLLILVLAVAGTVVGAMISPVRLAHIQLPAEPILPIGGFQITNTMLAAWLVTIVLLVLFGRGASSMQTVPSGLQNFVEMVTEFVLGLCESVAGVKRGRQFFPLVATIFFFVITANWMGLLPGFGSIGITETVGEETGFIPLLRSASTDLNTTLAIALVSVIATQIVGLRALGGGYVEKFLNFRGGPIGIYVGLLELIAEFAKIISFTFRLFGNVFAGEVLLAVITFLVPWVAAIPFYGLELFVGFIQAFVFAILTLVFMTLATTSHERHEEAHEASHH